MGTSPWRLVTVDIDGTLTTTHGWLEIAREFGREADYRALLRRFRAGEINEDQNIAGLLEFVEGRSLAEVEKVLEATPKLAHIPEGVARFQEEGIHVALLTHNPAYVTDWYRRYGGFEDAAGLFGRQPVGEVIGRAEAIRTDKAGGLRELTHRFEVVPSSVVHVGDGGADAAVFSMVGRGVALNSRLPAVDRAADLVLRSTDFQAVVEGVLALNPRA
ncbi:MAG: HAD hydrolase family protein [Thermoplasmata archaeon]